MTFSREEAPYIWLATANARFSHPAFGLRYLKANMGRLTSQIGIAEFTLSESPEHMAQSLLAHSPKIIGLGVYIWNVSLLTRVAHRLKADRPDIVLVIGGPEVSFEYEKTAIFESADYLVRGEADLAFRELAGAILEGRRPQGKVIEGGLPDLAALALPYETYSDEDLARRITYVEASRGCPYHCEFCLSSLDPRVREFPLEPLLESFKRLIERGTSQFKFVDRTFNLREDRCVAILDFFLTHWRDGMRLHFEIVPDKLSETLIEGMRRFPDGGLHLEVGVQTLNPDVLERISRRQDVERSLGILQRLRTETGALIHADLVLGLPGETWESLAGGFDRLIRRNPHELQVGILKRLKGAPIDRHTETFGMVFSEEPPYEVLENNTLNSEQMQRLKRFARYFDLYYNSGNFPQSLAYLWKSRPSHFDVFMALSDSLWAATNRTHQLPLALLAEHLYRFLVDAGVDIPANLAEVVEADFRRLPGRKDKLNF